MYNRQSNSFHKIKWSQVKVGDVIKVEKDQEIPADILILDSPKEVVFVSTMNLDGETNLKEKSLKFKDMRS
jgi:phospholipid-translocating ATPase